MRIRSIKPEFWSDKRVASWDTFTRLFFIGLWSAADDYGRGSAEAARLAAELFPYDLSRDPRETLASVSRALATLSAESRITLYEVGNEQFFEVCNWVKHQRVDRPGKSRIPTPSDEFATLSRDSRETLATPSRLEQGAGSMEQGTGNLCRAEARPCTSDLPLSPSEPTKTTTGPAESHQKVGEHSEGVQFSWLALTQEGPQDPSRTNHTTPPEKTPRTARRDAAKGILEFLNEQAGRSFEAVPANLTLIEQRLVDVEDDTDGVKAMVVRQVKKWSGSDMADYLRPATLFQKTKFRGYYDDRNQPVLPKPVNGQSKSIHPDGRPRSQVMQTIREVEAFLEQDK